MELSRTKYLTAPLTAATLAFVAFTGCGGEGEAEPSQNQPKIVESTAATDPGKTNYELREVASTRVNVDGDKDTALTTYRETYTVDDIKWICSLTVSDSTSYRVGGGVAKSCLTVPADR